MALGAYVNYNYNGVLLLKTQLLGSLVFAGIEQYSIFDLYGYLKSEFSSYQPFADLQDNWAYKTYIDIVVYSTIKPTANIQKLSGLPGKYRLGDSGYFNDLVCLHDEFLQFTAQRLKPACTYITKGGSQGYLPTPPLSSQQALGIGDTYNIASEDPTNLRSYIGPITDFHVIPYNGVSCVVSINYFARLGSIAGPSASAGGSDYFFLSL